MSMYSSKKYHEDFIFGLSRKQFVTYCLQIIVIFSATFLALYIFGLVPESVRQVAQENNANNDTSSGENWWSFIKIDTNTALDTEVFIKPVSEYDSQSIRPSRVIIPSIGVDSNIEHPQSQNVDDLDVALTKGAVYYPGSGTIGKGNIFLFGHSTSFQIVRNQAYKTFNGLDKLKAGEMITLWGEDGNVYGYKVEKVSLADENEALVEFNAEDGRLTISTCNTFGQKQERWVVEAVFVGRDDV